MAIPFLESIVSFVIALLIGGLAIYISARLVVDVDDYSHAVITAVLGAIGWALTAWIPLVGPIIALVAWIWVIKWRDPGGWRKAGIIGVVALIAALVILFVVNSVFRLGVGAFGIPGV
jgi:O-antigen ligase